MSDKVAAVLLFLIIIFSGGKVYADTVPTVDVECDFLPAEGGMSLGVGPTQYRWRGACPNGRPTGLGYLYTRTQGDASKDYSLRYMGQIENGALLGIGTIFYPSGDIAVIGIPNAGHANQVTIYYKNGAIYSGLPQDSTHVEGAMRYTDASFYNGSWYNRKYDGYGYLQLANGDNYTGYFRSGRFNGTGVYTTASGTVLIGSWIEGLASGPVRVVSPNGLLFEGEMKKGLRDGAGTMNTPNGDRYEGGWSADKPSGSGTLYQKDGTRHTGKWDDGCLKDGANVVKVEGIKSQCE